MSSYKLLTKLEELTPLSAHVSQLSLLKIHLGEEVAGDPMSSCLARHLSVPNALVCNELNYWVGRYVCMHWTDLT